MEYLKLKTLDYYLKKQYKFNGIKILAKTSFFLFHSRKRNFSHRREDIKWVKLYALKRNFS